MFEKRDLEILKLSEIYAILELLKKKFIIDLKREKFKCMMKKNVNI